MKRKISFAAAYLCLLSLLTLGCWELCFAPREERISQTENRMLRAFPSLTAAALADGSYMEDFEGFLSDAFPVRDGVIGLSKRMLSVFGGETEEEENAARREALGAGGEELPVPAEEPAPARPAAQVPAADPAPAPAAPVSDAPADPALPAPRDAALWMVGLDGSIQVQEEYPYANIAHLARVLNMYRDALAEDGQVHFINVPVSYMGKYLFYHRMSGWGCDLDEVLRPLVKEGVYIYDVTDFFGDAVFTEPLYSLAGDHHWYPRGGWRTAAVMTENQGLVPLDYYEYLYRLESDFRGKPLTRSQLESIPVAVAARDIQVMVPISPVESYIVKHLTELSPSAYMDDNRIEHYGIWLGGRRGPYRLFVTGFHTGRNALVIGDSFYHAFLPYMTPYYDRILAVDPRDEMYNPNTVGPDISTYMRQYDIDDIYFVTCTYTSVNGNVFQDRLERHLYEDSAAAVG